MTRTLALAIASALAACRQSTPEDRAAPPRGPVCFAVDPGQPSGAGGSGTVTDVREDFTGTAIVVDSVWDSFGRHGTSHLRFTPKDDHLEALFGGTLVRADVKGPLAAPISWSMRYKDQQYEFTEAYTYDAAGMTVASTDPTSGAPVVTRVHFHGVSCVGFDKVLAAAH